MYISVCDAYAMCMHIHFVETRVCGHILRPKHLGKRFAKIFHTSLIITRGNMMSVELCIYSLTQTQMQTLGVGER